jgi:glycosyltransferase involved in cell wall biosynthesis
MPFISICIPAYKNPDYLLRLLNSISIQSFKDFEVIITDDSPDDSIRALINKYKSSFAINYCKNETSLGTPVNWNVAISKASGKWIKLMHHDDWFAQNTSLEIFAASTLPTNADFIFSGFTEVKNNGHKKEYIISNTEKALLKKSPLNLFKKNFIGHPSTTLIKNNRQIWYDENTKWVVDFEFYIRCLQETKFISIAKSLINIGIHDAQVTKETFRNPGIEIPENLYLLNKLGGDILKNIFVYDYYWRLFRNLGIRKFEQVDYYLKDNNLPASVKKMLQFQLRIPLTVLRIGIFSKACMLFAKIFSAFTDQKVVGN